MVNSSVEKAVEMTVIFIASSTSLFFVPHVSPLSREVQMGGSSTDDKEQVLLELTIFSKEHQKEM